MEKKNKKEVWFRLKCRCGKTHYYKKGVCPCCGIYEVIEPVSENVSCERYICDGCDAYGTHQR
jgi:hypothetical protein